MKRSFFVFAALLLVSASGQAIIGGSEVAADKLVTITAGNEKIPIVLPGGPQGPRGPAGATGKSGGVIFHSSLDDKIALINELKAELNSMKGTNLMLRAIEKEVFPAWAVEETACPDGWTRLGYNADADQVLCAPPGNNETPKNKVCDAVAKFTQKFDRCGWSIVCKASWRKHGCYPLGVPSDTPIFVPNQQNPLYYSSTQLVPAAAPASSAPLKADASRTFEGVLGLLTSNLRAFTNGLDSPQDMDSPQFQIPTALDYNKFKNNYAKKVDEPLTTNEAKLQQARELVKKILSDHAVDLAKAAEQASGGSLLETASSSSLSASLLEDHTTRRQLSRKVPAHAARHQEPL